MESLDNAVNIESPEATPINGQPRGRRTNISASKLGRWIGEAVGEGIAQGTERAFAELSQDIGPLVAGILDALRADLTAAAVAAVDHSGVAEHVAAHDRVCVEPGCQEPSLARGLCRRHYARKLYRERKTRQGGAAPVARRQRREPEVEVIEKKLAPVAPIIRRKKMDGPANDEIRPMAAAANGGPHLVPPQMDLPVAQPAPSDVMENVAKFFSREK